MNNPTTDPRAAYDQYLRRGIQTPEVLNEAPSGVGYLLPQHLETKLVNAMNTISVLRPLCTEVTTTGDSALPVVNGHGKASWVPEGHPIPLVKDAFDRVNLDSHKLAAIIRVTNELLKDSAIDIEDHLAATFADRLAVSEEEAFLAGDGVDKPLGLIHQAKVGCTTENAGTVSLMKKSLGRTLSWNWSRSRMANAPLLTRLRLQIRCMSGHTTNSCITAR